MVGIDARRERSEPGAPGLPPPLRAPILTVAVVSILIWACSAGGPPERATAAANTGGAGAGAVGVETFDTGIEFGAVAPGSVVTRERAVKLRISSSFVTWRLYTSASSDLTRESGPPSIPVGRLQWSLFKPDAPPQWTPYQTASMLVASGQPGQYLCLDVRLDLTYPGSYELPADTYSTTLTHTVTMGVLDQSFVSPDPFLPDGVSKVRFWFYSTITGTRQVALRVFSPDESLAFYQLASMDVSGWGWLEWDGRVQDGTLAAPGLYRYTVDVMGHTEAEGVFAVSAAPSPGSAALTGSVVGGGLPLQGADVSVRALATRHEIGRALTGDDGRYRVNNLPEGSAYAEASCPGYLPFTSGAFTLRPDQATQQDFSLTPNKAAFVSVAADSPTVQPGDLFNLVVRVRNSGTRTMKACVAWLDLPSGLYPVSKDALGHATTVGPRSGPGGSCRLKVDVYGGDLSPGETVRLVVPMCAGLCLEDRGEVTVRAGVVSRVGSEVDTAEAECTVAVHAGRLGGGTGDLAGKVVLARPAEVTGVAGEAPLAPVPGAYVSVSDGRFSRAGADGGFAFEGVACGPHLVTARANLDGQVASGRTLVTVTPGRNLVIVVIEPEPLRSSVDVEGELHYDRRGWGGDATLAIRAVGERGTRALVAVVAGGDDRAGELAALGMGDDRADVGLVVGKLNVASTAPRSPEVEETGWMVGGPDVSWGGWLPGPEEAATALRALMPDTAWMEGAWGGAGVDGLTMWCGDDGRRAWVAAGRAVVGLVSDVFDGEGCGPYPLTRVPVPAGESPGGSVPLWVMVTSGPPGRTHSRTEAASVDVDPSCVRFEPALNAVWLDRPPRDYLGLPDTGDCYVVVTYTSLDAETRPVVVAGGLTLSGNAPVPWRLGAWGTGGMVGGEGRTASSGVVAQAEPGAGSFLHYSRTTYARSGLAWDAGVAALGEPPELMTWERLGVGLRLASVTRLQLGVDRISAGDATLPQTTTLVTRAFLAASGELKDHPADPTDPGEPAATTTWKLGYSEPLAAPAGDTGQWKATLERNWRLGSASLDAVVDDRGGEPVAHLSRLSFSTRLNGTSLTLRAGLDPGVGGPTFSGTAALPGGTTISASLSPQAGMNGGEAGASDWDLGAAFVAGEGAVSSAGVSLSERDDGSSSVRTTGFHVELDPSPGVHARLEGRFESPGGGSEGGVRLTLGGTQGPYGDLEVDFHASGGASSFEATVSTGTRVGGASVAVDVGLRRTTGALAPIAPAAPEAREAREGQATATDGSPDGVSCTTGRISVRSGIRLPGGITLYLEHAFSVQSIEDACALRETTEERSSGSLYLDWCVAPGLALRVGYMTGYEELPWLEAGLRTRAFSGPFVRLVASGEFPSS